MEDSLSERVVKPGERALVGDLGTNPITERDKDVSKVDGLESSQPKGSIESQRGGRSFPRAEEGTKCEGIQCTPTSIKVFSGMKRYDSVLELCILSPSSSFYDRPSSPKRLLGQRGAFVENKSVGREEPRLLQTPLPVLMPSRDYEINSLMGNDVKVAVER